MNYRFDDDGNVLPPIPKSIYEINSYIKGLIEEEAQLQEIYAVGEISNFKKHSSGHFYLTLKDDKSEIRAVMFRSYAQRVRFKPQDGMRVIVSGRIGVYSQAGSYQLYIESMQPDGIGSLHLAFEQLKAKMNEEGLFDDAHKKSIPKYPNTIGVITSPTGAAVKDIIKVATRRYPCAKIVVFPSLVQGTDAPGELIKGIEYFNIMNSVDVIIIGRGGGSMEDLWAFNDEGLARAIFRSHIPVISAVGHEIDFTICDFVSDVRAATPSHAAELATPNIEEIAYRLNEFSQRALDSIINTVEAYRVRLDDLASSRVLVKPLTLLDIPNLKLAGATDKLYKAFQDRIKQDREKFIQLNAKLLALNPMSVLNRGYGAICDSENRVISTVNSVEINDNINIMLCDGRISATVTKKERREKNG
ncbi:MAG: exodeoxyribonuclease VII large subunit [Clostridia bacterium]|nr:exodeoxyribonuclease VII large subunit [Clostridia bacterium]